MVAALAGLGLLYVTGRMLHGPAPALWGCLLLAVAVPQVRYAQEARGYTLLVLLFLGACLGVVRVERMGATWLRLAAVSICTGAALLTHYHAAGPLTGLAVYGMVTLRDGARARLALAFGFAAVGASAIWGPFLIDQRQAMLRPVVWQHDDPAERLEHPLLRLAAFPGTQFTVSEWRRGGESPGAVVLVLAAVALAARRRETRLWTFTTVGLLAPLVVLDLALSVRQLAVTRYGLVAGPGLCMLVATAWRHTTKRAHLLPGLVALLAISSLPRAYVPRKPDWRGFAALLHEMASPGEPLVLLSTKRGDYRYIYVALAHYLPRRSFPVMVVSNGPSGSDRASLIDSGTVWAVGEANAELIADRRPWLQRVFPEAEVETVLTVPPLPPVQRLRFGERRDQSM